jgi:hypothetical protein
MRAEAITVVTVVCAASILAVQACGRSIPSAGFWYEDIAFALPAQAAGQLGGLLTDGELDSIKTISRAEVAHAFTGFNIHVVDDHAAFWRVGVERSLRRRRLRPREPARAQS